MVPPTSALARLCLPLALVLAAALAVLALRPGLDLDVAHAFYLGGKSFVGQTRAGTLARFAAWALPFLVYAGLLVAWVVTRASSRAGPSGRAVLFLTASLAIGPGLLVHAGLKELSHRPRPYDVVAFGGRDAFRPFTRFDGACRHNCSFASGETAAATWMLAPASLVPPWRGAAYGVAIVFAAATGALRMASGAHFLSDVCAGALVTILVVLALRAAILPRE